MAPDKILYAIQTIRKGKGFSAQTQWFLNASMVSNDFTANRDSNPPPWEWSTTSRPAPAEVGKEKPSLSATKSLARNLKYIDTQMPPPPELEETHRTLMYIGISVFSHISVRLLQPPAVLPILTYCKLL